MRKCRRTAQMSVALLATTGLLTGLTANPAAAQAQAGAEPAAEPTATDEQEEVVVTGTRFLSNAGEASLKLSVPVRDIPLSVASYSKEFLNSLTTTRLEDLYGYMPGVTRSGNTGLNVNLRGFSANNGDRGTLLVDGLPGLAATFGSPSTANIESIELVKGANSVLFGKSQPGGFLNIVTKKPLDHRFAEARILLNGVYGQDSDFGGSINHTETVDFTGPLVGSLDYRLIGEHSNGDGWRDFARTRSWYVTPSLKFDLGPSVTAIAHYEFRHENSQHDEGLVAPNNDTRLIADIHSTYQEPGDTKTETGHAVSVSLDVRLPAEFKWRTGFRWVDTRNRTLAYEVVGVTKVTPSAQFPSGWRVNRSDRDIRNERRYVFGDTNLSRETAIFGTTHHLLLGVSAGKETFDSDRFQYNPATSLAVDLYDIRYGLPHPGPLPNRHRVTTGENLSFYFQDFITFIPELKGVVAIRHDHEDQASRELRLAPNDLESKTSAWVPLVGLLFQPNKALSFYVSHSESFNPPGPNDVDANGVPLTKPEVGKQKEAGVKVNLFQNRLKGTIALYDIRLSNTVANLGRGVFANLGKIKSRGYEIEVDAAPIEGWEIQAGYAFNDSAVLNDPNPFVIGQSLFSAPRHSASVFSRYDIHEGALSGLGFSLGIAAVGTRYASFAASAAELRVTLPSYTKVDAGIYYAFGDWELSARFRNIFDKKYLSSATGNTSILIGEPAGMTLALQRRF